METRKNNILVLALGNDIMGDDGAALEAAGILEKKFADEIDIFKVSSAGFMLLDILEGYEKVIIIDRDITYIGSLNALSNTGKTGEVMLRMEGTAATERIAQWMNAAARTSSRRT